MNAELTNLQQQIWQSGDTPAKVALLEQAIQLVDSMNDIENGFDLRNQLIQTAVFSGQPEKLLVAFSWNLSQVDRDPEQYDESDLLWQYKWVIPALCEFPQITREQLESSLADLSCRFQRQGASQRPVHTLQCKIAAVMGDTEKIRTTLPLWKDAKRDWLSDCKACDQDCMVEMHVLLGQDLEALKMAQPILAGRSKCAEVPHLTLPSVLLPLLRLNRLEDAKKYSRQGYTLIRNNPNFIVKLAEILVFQVLIDDLDSASDLFEAHLRFALESQSPLRRYKFFLAAALLFRRLTHAAWTKAKWRFPTDFPLWNERGVYDLQQLAEWFEKEARGLAKEFDSRAGNDFRLREVSEIRFDDESHGAGFASSPAE